MADVLRKAKKLGEQATALATPLTNEAEALQEKKANLDQYLTRPVAQPMVVSPITPVDMVHPGAIYGTMPGEQRIDVRNMLKSLGTVPVQAAPIAVPIRDGGGGRASLGAGSVPAYTYDEGTSAPPDVSAMPVMSTAMPTEAQSISNYQTAAHGPSLLSKVEGSLVSDKADEKEKPQPIQFKSGSTAAAAAADESIPSPVAEEPMDEGGHPKGDNVSRGFQVYDDGGTTTGTGEKNQELSRERTGELLNTSTGGNEMKTSGLLGERDSSEPVESMAALPVRPPVTPGPTSGETAANIKAEPLAESGKDSRIKTKPTPDVNDGTHVAAILQKGERVLTPSQNAEWLKEQHSFKAMPIQPASTEASIENPITEAQEKGKVMFLGGKLMPLYDDGGKGDELAMVHGDSKGTKVQNDTKTASPKSISDMNESDIFDQGGELKKVETAEPVSKNSKFADTLDVEDTGGLIYDNGGPTPEEQVDTAATQQHREALEDRAVDSFQRDDIMGLGKSVMGLKFLDQHDQQKAATAVPLKSTELTAPTSLKSETGVPAALKAAGIFSPETIAQPVARPFADLDTYEQAGRMMSPEQQAVASQKETLRQQIIASKDPMTTARLVQEFNKLKLATPLGTPESRMPGMAGKILHGLGVGAEALGTMAAGAPLTAIPGTRAHTLATQERASEQEEKLTKEQLEKAQALRTLYPVPRIEYKMDQDPNSPTYKQIVPYQTPGFYTLPPEVLKAGGLEELVPPKAAEPSPTGVTTAATAAKKPTYGAGIITPEPFYGTPNEAQLTQGFLRVASMPPAERSPEQQHFYEDNYGTLGSKMPLSKINPTEYQKLQADMQNSFVGAKDAYGNKAPVPPVITDVDTQDQAAKKVEEYQNRLSTFYATEPTRELAEANAQDKHDKTLALNLTNRNQAYIGLYQQEQYRDAVDDWQKSPNWTADIGIIDDLVNKQQGGGHLGLGGLGTAVGALLGAGAGPAGVAAGAAAGELTSGVLNAIGGVANGYLTALKKSAISPEGYAAMQAYYNAMVSRVQYEMVTQHLPATAFRGAFFANKIMSTIPDPSTQRGKAFDDSFGKYYGPMKYQVTHQHWGALPKDSGVPPTREDIEAQQKQAAAPSATAPTGASGGFAAWKAQQK